MYRKNVCQGRTRSGVERCHTEKPTGRRNRNIPSLWLHMAVSLEGFSNLNERWERRRTFRHSRGRGAGWVHEPRARNKGDRPGVPFLSQRRCFGTARIAALGGFGCRLLFFIRRRGVSSEGVGSAAVSTGGLPVSLKSMAVLPPSVGVSGTFQGINGCVTQAAALNARISGTTCPILHRITRKIRCFPRETAASLF